MKIEKCVVCKEDFEKFRKNHGSVVCSEECAIKFNRSPKIYLWKQGN